MTPPPGRPTTPADEPAETLLDRVRPRTFKRQIVVSTVLVVTVAVVAVGLGLQIVLDRTARRDIGTVLEDRAQAMVRVIDRASTSRLTVPSGTLEPGMEVFDADGRKVAGTLPRRLRDVADDLARVTTPTERSGPEEEYRLLGTPFTTPSGDRGVLVTTQETAPYERSEFYALIATAVLGLLLVGATAIVARRVTRRALEPVEQMAARAADWSERDLAHRFDLGPPDNELAALGETLDHLLDRVASAILAEQRLTSELAHELRTPLTAIRGTADLALLRGLDDQDATRRDLQQISRSAQEMSGVIAALLDIAREGGAGRGQQTCLVADVVAAVLDSLIDSVPDTLPVTVRVEGSRARVAASGDLVARALAPLVDNAARYARRGVSVTATDASDHVLVLVSDDGPGVPEELRESLFDPGVTEREGGAGLGLGIARRAARSFGGEVELELDGAAGTTFALRLPRR